MRRLLSVQFVRDAALTGGTQVFQAVGAMLGGIVVARELGPSGTGTISVVVALGSLSVLLAMLGVHTSSIYYLGRFKQQRDAIISNNLVAGTLGGLATGLMLAGVVVLFRSQLLHHIGLGLFFAYLMVVPFNYFNEFTRRTALGIGRVATYNVPDLMSGVVLLLGTIVALSIFGHHLLPLMVLRVALEVSISGILVWQLHRHIKYRFEPSWRLFRAQLRYGLRNYLSAVFWLILLQGDILLCNHFLGSAKTGVYSIAVSLGLPITLLGTVVGTLMFQRVSADQDRDARIANMNRAVRLLTPLVIVACGLIALAAWWVVPRLYGASFSSATTALLLLLPGTAALSLEIVLINFLAGEGSPSIVYWGPIIGVLLNFGANLFVIPRWGINGAATTSSVGYAAVFALVLAYYTRSTRSTVADLLIVRRVDLREMRRAKAAAV